MRKRTKILFGVAILIAIVSMNMRHAWMNYGIYRDVEAETSASKIYCPPKDGFPVVKVNVKTDSTIFEIQCIAKIVSTYQYVDSVGRVHTWTETIDFKNAVPVPSPMSNDISENHLVKRDTTFEDLVSIEYTCKEYLEGKCCYAKSAEQECAKLFKMSASK